MQLSSSSAVDLLILGAGWTATFLIPHLRSDHPDDISYATTTRDGRDRSIQWTFNPDLEGPEQFAALPRAKTVLVVFPIRGPGGSARLVQGYEEAIGARARWIQLGSTGIFDVSPDPYSIAIPSLRHLACLGGSHPRHFAGTGCVQRRQRKAGRPLLAAAARMDDSPLSLRQDECASDRRRRTPLATPRDGRAQPVWTLGAFRFGRTPGSQHDMRQEHAG